MSFDANHTPFEAIGGEEAVRALVDAFYDHMDRDEDFKVIRDLHPADLEESREKLHLFLCGWLGGPPLYVQKHGHPRLRMRHAPFPIGETERDQWLDCMARAMEDREVTGALRDFLDARFAHVADFMRNR
ncbi:MAG: group II truncated hemoglobin [Planctomycetota bacterium]|nr:group II truncated hemoglobin [Planctomycetota bacterium]